MKKHICICLAAAMLTGGCAQTAAVKEPEASPEETADVRPEESQGTGEIDYRSGKPWMVIDLAGNVTEDTPVNVKDDFALYANKEAILAIPLGENDVSAGPLIDAGNQKDEDLRNLFAGEAPDSHDAKLAFDFYELLCDWDSRNAVGIEPLKKMTDRIEAVSSLEELTAYFTTVPREERIADLWSSYPYADLDDADRNIAVISTSHFSYDEPQEYKEPTEDSQRNKAALEDYAVKMCKRLGYDEAEGKKKTENCLKIEAMLAEGLPSRLEMQKADYIGRTNNTWTREELKAAEENVPIIERLEQADGYPEQEKFRVMEPEFIGNLTKVYTEENLPLIKDYLIIHGIQLNGSSLDWDSYVLDTEYSRKVLGDEDPKPADLEEFKKEAHTTVLGFLPWPMSRLYVDRYMHPEDKERISQLTDEIIEEYYGIINEADFLSEKSREGAIAKLDHMNKKIAYPDDWSPYSCEDLNIRTAAEGGTFWEAKEHIEKYEYRKSAEQLSKPIDKTLWEENPMVVNCQYDPYTNNILLYSGYIKAIYRPDMSEEELYAKIGTAIGHEISHAFDDRGSQYDANGNLADWWDSEDFKVFTEKNRKLAAYFDAMQPWDGAHYNGEIMTGEACADMAGMKVVLRLAAKNPDFDYDKFFRAYAALWMIKENLMITEARLKDVHPLKCLRINSTLQQYDDFLNFYDIREGDGMYLAPQDRVAIW